MEVRYPPPRYPMKTRQMGAIPPSAILSRKGIARYGGVSLTGPLRVCVCVCVCVCGGPLCAVLVYRFWPPKNEGHEKVTSKNVTSNKRSDSGSSSLVWRYYSHDWPLWCDCLQRAARAAIPSLDLRRIWGYSAISSDT